jgi:hypothetical protein
MVWLLVILVFAVRARISYLVPVLDIFNRLLDNYQVLRIPTR